MDEHLSLKEYAIRRGVHPSLITRMKQQGRLVMVGNRVHVAGSDALLDKDRDLRGGNRTADSEGFDPAATDATRADYMLVKTRDTHWSSETKRLKALKDAGELVEADKVEREAFEQARLLRDAFLNIPDRIAATLAAETDPIAVHTLLLKEIRSVCNELATS